MVHASWRSLIGLSAVALASCGAGIGNGPGNGDGEADEAPFATAKIFQQFRPYDGLPPESVFDARFPGGSDPVGLPAALGDNVAFVEVHFADNDTGAALVYDLDGLTLHVLTYEGPSNAWVEVKRITDPWLVSAVEWARPRGAFETANLPNYLLKSWSDGSYLVAIAFTDTQSFAQQVWSLSSVGGGTPTERWTPLVTSNDPLLDPSSKMYLNLTGATTPFQLNAVALSVWGHQPAQAAFLSFDVYSGAPTVQQMQSPEAVFHRAGFTGTDDYFLGVPTSDSRWVPLHRATRHCRATACSDPAQFWVSPVANFGFATLASSPRPIPWVKIADFRGASPAIHTVTLPTDSSEMDFRALLPDPRNLGWVRIVAYDSDIEMGHVEFTYKPESGEVARIDDAPIRESLGCLKLTTYAGCFGPSNWYEMAPQSFFFPSSP